jgi:hypothetical protein
VKVQYLKKHTDEFGMTYEKGWTAEHSGPEATRRILAGLCREMDSEVRARKSGITRECVGKKMNDAKAAWKKQHGQKTQNTKK